ncbi:MAG: LacI family DNA-binding transcriptional regulator [Rhodobacteraceae bacterium]|nr:LacI family DNA-binding transcriptional regulator [Paracoccaceae bacterium]
MPTSHSDEQPNALPTLDDVARLAGVSTATVSRCLNAPKLVSEATRERVLAVVNELGYAPNFSAQALAAKRTNTIGAIIPTMENSIFARGLQAFQEELANHGLTLLVASSAYQRDLEFEQVKTLLARGADALLLIGFDRPEETMAFIRKRQVPAIISWAYRAESEVSSVGFDSREAIKPLAAEVLRLGHRKIAIIAAPQAENDRSRDRVGGVFDTHIEAGLSTDHIRVVETPYSVANGREAALKLLQGDTPPTVIMCGNDVLAVGVVQAAQALGLCIPEDVSVTGFDDIEIAEIVEPKLTTVHVPHRQMGAQSARQIAAVLKDMAPPQNIKLETEVVMRGSLGRPKS